MIELNSVLDQLKSELKLRYPALEIQSRKSQGMVPAEGDEEIVASATEFLDALARRHRVLKCRIENGFSTVGEGFSSLVSHACASYAYFSMELVFDRMTVGELAPFAMQGTEEVRNLGAVVEQQEGLIQIEASDANALRCTVRLPIARRDSLERHVEKPATGKTILLVEDEEFVRNVTQEVLEMEGYQVRAVGSGQDALKVVESEGDDFDLLLTDVVLPGINGRELAATLGAQLSGLKVMFMSGYTDNPVLRTDVAKQATYYLQKPFTLDALIERVKDILEPPVELLLAQRAAAATVEAGFGERA